MKQRARASLSGAMADNLARQIEEGVLPAGAKLPSIREYAEASGCSKNTVISAFEMLAADDRGAWIVQTPRLPLKANGSGDVTAALFTAHYVSTGDAALALRKTVSSVFDLLERTLASGERELQLVECGERMRLGQLGSSCRMPRFERFADDGGRLGQLPRPRRQRGDLVGDCQSDRRWQSRQLKKRIGVCFGGAARARR